MQSNRTVSQTVPGIKINDIGEYRLDAQAESRVKQVLQAPVTKNDQSAYVNAIYKDIDQYQAKHLDKIAAYKAKYLNTPKGNTTFPVFNENDPCYFRKMFGALIENSVNNPNYPYHYKGSEKDREKNPVGAGVTLEDFLTESGAELYRLALEEERYTKEFMHAVLAKSTTEYAGKPWAERPVLIMGGPSAAGKTVAANETIKKMIDTIQTTGDDARFKNYVVAVDGGDVREVSQMRKLVIRAANSKGFAHITDLHKQSDVLESVKKHIQKFVLEDDCPHGVVIPLTFSALLIPGGMKRLLFKISKLSGAQLAFCQVVGKDPELFKKTVQFQGERRAVKKDWSTPVDFSDINSNANLSESKIYEPQYFDAGLSNSNRAEALFNLFTGANYSSYRFINDRVLKKFDLGKWHDASPADKDVVIVNQSVFDKWLTSQLLPYAEVISALEALAIECKNSEKPIFKQFQHLRKQINAVDKNWREEFFKVANIFEKKMHREWSSEHLSRVLKAHGPVGMLARKVIKRMGEGDSAEKQEIINCIKTINKRILTFKQLEKTFPSKIALSDFMKNHMARPQIILQSRSSLEVVLNKLQEILLLPKIAKDVHLSTMVTNIISCIVNLQTLFKKKIYNQQMDTYLSKLNSTMKEARFAELLPNLDQVAKIDFISFVERYLQGSVLSLKIRKIHQSYPYIIEMIDLFGIKQPDLNDFVNQIVSNDEQWKHELITARSLIQNWSKENHAVFSETLSKLGPIGKLVNNTENDRKEIFNTVVLFAIEVEKQNKLQEKTEIKPQDVMVGPDKDKGSCTYSSSSSLMFTAGKLPSEIFDAWKTLKDSISALQSQNLTPYIVQIEQEIRATPFPTINLPKWYQELKIADDAYYTKTASKSSSSSSNTANDDNIFFNIFENEKNKNNLVLKGKFESFFDVCQKTFELPRLSMKH